MEPIAKWKNCLRRVEWSRVGWGGGWGGGVKPVLSNSYYSTKQEKVHIKAVGEARRHFSPQTPPTQHSAPQSGRNLKLELL